MGSVMRWWGLWATLLCFGQAEASERTAMARALTTACEAGDLESCGALTGYWGEVEALERRKERPRAGATAAAVRCAVGSARGCTGLGEFFVEGGMWLPSVHRVGSAVRGRLWRFKTWLRREQSCSFSINVSLFGYGGVWAERGLTLLKRSCESGEQEACRIAAMVDIDQWPDDDAAAVLRGLCADGDALSCGALARVSGNRWVFLRNGGPHAEVLSVDGVFDPGIWARLGCEMGDAESCASYAHWSLGEEPELELGYLQRACDGGSQYGCRGLSALYLAQGEAGREAARETQRRGCLLGDYSSCQQLAELSLLAEEE